MLHHCSSNSILYDQTRKDFFGELKLIQFGLATLAIHVFIGDESDFPKLLMNEGHVYSWSTYSCLEAPVTWLFLPLCLLNVKFNPTENH